VFGCQRPQHDPRSVTAADCECEATTVSDRRTSIRSDCRGSRSRDGVSIVKHFKLHEVFSKREQSDALHIGCEDQSQSSYTRPTLSASLGGNAEIFLVRGARVMPASSRRNSLLDLSRPPGTFLVLVDRSAGLQHRVDDSPRLFHIILAGKQGGVSGYRVAQHALVRFHLVWTRMTAGHHLHAFAFQCLALTHDGRAHRYGHLRTDPEP